MIFGGLQKGEDENTQLVLLNVENFSYLGVQSHLKFTDYF